MNFEKLKSKYDKRYKLGLLIGIVLIVVGVATIKMRILTSVLEIVMGISMIAMARKNNENIKQEIAKVTDPQDFDKSMEHSLYEMMEFSLYISDKYVVSELRGLNVFVLKDMKKFEVGIAGDKKKTLFLTDKSGVRHEIASTVKGDKRQDSFDQAYYRVKDIFDNKKYK